jgi:hypothetical protein
MRRLADVEGFAERVRPFVDSARDIQEEWSRGELPRGADWPWSALVGSMATMGGSRNYIQRIEPRITDFEWSRVAELPLDERRALFAEVNPRYGSRVVGYLEAIFDKIAAAGGPENVCRSYDELESAHERVDFLRQFKGVGPKYARNIPLDFRDRLVSHRYIAIDSRLDAIIEAWTDELHGYEEKERFLRNVARVLGVSAWVLDRVLYAEYKRIVGAVSRATDAASVH